MKRFEDLHIEDQMRLALEALRMTTAGNCGTIETFAKENGLTVREFWRDICANEGFDECEPWKGFPEGPTLDSFGTMPRAVIACCGLIIKRYLRRCALSPSRTSTDGIRLPRATVLTSELIVFRDHRANVWKTKN